MQIKLCLKTFWNQFRKSEISVLIIGIHQYYTKYINNYAMLADKKLNNSKKSICFIDFVFVFL